MARCSLRVPCYRDAPPPLHSRCCNHWTGMAIRRFDVGPSKGLQRAAASDLPNLVAIAGPNGAGKSSLLEQLRVRREEFVEPNTDFLFVGAHRTWRSGVVTEVTALGF